jgi:hypothetical protein
MINYRVCAQPALYALNYSDMKDHIKNYFSPDDQEFYCREMKNAPVSPGCKYLSKFAGNVRA